MTPERLDLSLRTSCIAQNTVAGPWKRNWEHSSIRDRGAEEDVWCSRRSAHYWEDCTLLHQPLAHSISSSGRMQAGWRRHITQKWNINIDPQEDYANGITTMRQHCHCSLLCSALTWFQAQERRNLCGRKVDIPTLRIKRIEFQC